jgi:hypothetical protein
VNTLAWFALGAAAAFAILLAPLAAQLQRGHIRRNEGYEAARKRPRYSAAELADLSRDGIDPGWDAVKAMLPDCAGEYPKTRQQGETNA